MSSPQTMGQWPRRSRKGCPECRRRKIKCDEKRPECGQCRRSGRECRILDSLFRPHSYSFMTPSSQDSRPRRASRRSRSPEQENQPVSPETHGTEVVWSKVTHDTQQVEFAESAPGDNVSRTRAATASPIRHAELPHPPRSVPDTLSVAGLLGEGDSVTPAQPLAILQAAAEISPQQTYHDEAHIDHTSPGQRAHISHVSLGLPEDSYSDRCETAFFLRYFSECLGQWMDICNGSQSYFSEQVISLSQKSPLVRYAASALAAKQLGQMKDPESKIRQSHSAKVMLKAFKEPQLNFLWYGAKYYEKAIQLLAQQISHEDRSTCHLSPCCIYQSGLTPQSTTEHSFVGEHDNATSTYQILAACLLCQYEDLSATMGPWSGHLDGIYKLLRPYLKDGAAFQLSVLIPQPLKAMGAISWYFVLNDMLDAFVSSKRTRFDFHSVMIWRKMGLPLDDNGVLVIDYRLQEHIEEILFMALIRLLCQLVNSNLSETVQWNHLKEEFDQWHDMLPPACFPIIWPPHASEDQMHQIPSPNSFLPEAWYPSDLLAITMAFYHMARMLLLIHRPMDIFLRQTANPADLLLTYNSLQQDLRQHSMHIIPIARGMPSDAVRKYLLQPLYVAGRCLADNHDREGLLLMLRQIDDDLGIFTDYRIKDLCREWGFSCDAIEKTRG